MNVKPVPRVAILVQTASEWSRAVLLGVADYIQEHSPWDVFLEPRGFYEHPTPPRGWRGDGILARLTGPPVRAAILRRQLPAVNVAWLGSHEAQIPQVISDPEACARLAANHLLDRQLTSFAMVGPLDGLPYGQRMAVALRTHLAPARHGFVEYTAEGTSWSSEQTRLRRWLSKLPLPCGLTAWNSAVGRRVVSLASEDGVRVPDELAVVCLEHDELHSRLSPVSLSSVEQDGRRVGAQAAALLDRLMAGGGPPAQAILVPPAGVIHRRSTDFHATDDAAVASALMHMRTTRGAAFNVSDMVRAAGVSRRAFEKRFRKELGRSPADELRRYRVERTKRLLLESRLSVKAIAYELGFSAPEVLTRTFTQLEGIAPQLWRNRRARFDALAGPSKPRPGGSTDKKGER